MAVTLTCKFTSPTVYGSRQAGTEEGHVILAGYRLLGPPKRPTSVMALGDKQGAGVYIQPVAAVPPYRSSF